MNELKTTLIWIFYEECEAPDDVQNLLIVRDAQGFTGKKVEIYSLPYSCINMWSSENAGRLLDFTAEIELWTRAGHIKLQLDKKIDVRQFDKLIAECVLNQ